VIVVDSNMLVYLYLDSERAIQMERVLLRDMAWAAPLLWRSEFRNVLSLYVRKRLLGLEVAHQVMARAVGFMEEREYNVASPQVLNLAHRSRCSAYDCEFVALALDLNVPLLTSDAQILAQFPETATSPERYLVSA
jgi:predicted nucleic acid-binding protein